MRTKIYISFIAFASYTPVIYTEYFYFTFKILESKNGYDFFFLINIKIKEFKSTVVRICS